MTVEIIRDHLTSTCTRTFHQLYSHTWCCDHLVIWMGWHSDGAGNLEMIKHPLKLIWKPADALIHH